MQKTFKIILPLILLLAITWVKLQFPEVLGQSTPFLMYTAVIVFATVYSGWMMGILISLLSLFPIVFYFLPPEYSFNLLPHHYSQLAVFLLQDGIVIAMSYALQKEKHKSSLVENRFKVLTEKAADLLVLRDANNRAIYVSPKVETVYGYTQEEYANMPIEKMVTPEYLQYFLQNFKEIKELPNAHRIVRIQAYRKDGELRWMEGEVYNFLNQPGINAIVSYIKDITDRVNLERQKDDFIGIASHELKTPLANIKGFVSLAEKTAKDKPENVIPFLSKAQHNITRLQRLVNDLLDISKINTGQLPYNLEVFNFSDLLKDTVKSLKMHHKKHEFLLSAPEQVMVNGDRFRLEQVLINLLENAVKYSPEADKVLVSAEISNSYLIVSIKDFGIGISEEHISKIFNRFYRVDNTSTKYQGLGLGLFIASEILKKHNGSFWLDSRLGEGSTFSFLLPYEMEVKTNTFTDNKTYLRTEYLEILYNKEKNWLEADWIGYQTKQTVQEGCMHLLDLVKSTGVTKVLNNNAKVKGNWSEAADWGSTVWFPLMEEAGIEFFAWIQSKDLFSQLSALKSVEMKSGEINIHFFDEMEAAAKWLEGDSNTRKV
ncbi:ATP-binding protein [Desertivirga brevis]|uniref:ATP-binding protein n=1 Tax=Desertivirga brevis TaxID=2810310 RepID=UPI001A95F68F